MPMRIGAGERAHEGGESPKYHQRVSVHEGDSIPNCPTWGNEEYDPRERERSGKERL